MAPFVDLEDWLGEPKRQAAKVVVLGPWRVARLCTYRPDACLFLLLGSLSFLFGGVVSGVLLAGAAGCLALSVAIVAVNRPRFLVPPPRRSDQGLIRLPGRKPSRSSVRAAHPAR